MEWKRIFGQRPMDKEIDDELRAHLAMAIQDRIDRGESPQEARRLARLELGNVGLVKEDTREIWTWGAIETLAQDLKYAWRRARNSPSFTALAVLTLALGLSVNATVFGLIDSLFLQPLPVDNAERLVVVLRQRASSEFLGGMSWSDYRDYQSSITEFSDLLALAFRPAHLSVEGYSADRTWIEAVSSNYFSMLGVTPSVGRLFRPGEGEQPGVDPVAVLGHDYWQTHLGGDPGIIGRAIVVNGHPLTIIGVASQGFSSVQFSMSPSAFVPATMMPTIFPGNESILKKRDSGAFKVMGHLRPGVSEAEASSAVSILARRLADEYRPEAEETHVFVRSERRTRPEPGVSSAVPFAAAVFAALAGLVLFIACANVANLMFSRAVARQKEMGIRRAIGAGRARLIRQLLTESLVIAVLAGATGLLLSFGTGLLLARLTAMTGAVPLNSDQQWSWLPAIWTLVVATLSGVATGLVPALRATKVDVVSTLKGSGSGVGPQRHLFRSGLVLGQVSVSVVVLICGGLFVHSLLQLASYDLGFQPDRLVMASVDLGLQGYDSDDGGRFLSQLTDRVNGLPDVEVAAIGSNVPFGLHMSTRAVVSPDDSDELRVGLNRVDQNYFDTLGVTFLRGRSFGRQDDASSPRVAVVNQTMAERLWPNQEAIGQHFRWQSGGDPIEVIGVVRNGKYLTLGEAQRSFVYLPIAQAYSGSVTLHVRTATDDPLALAPTIRDIIRGLDSDLPVYNVRTMDEHLRSSVFAFLPLRIGAALAGAQGLVALLLAVMGVYGVVAFSVSQRTREIGIRMALGARNSDMFRFVSRSGLRPAAIGLVIGVAASVALARLLTVLIYGLDPMNVGVFTAVVGLVLGASLLACWLPARRAFRMDPTTALRQD